MSGAGGRLSSPQGQAQLRRDRRALSGRRWLAEPPDGDWEGRQWLPSAVLAVVRRALRTASGVDAPAEILLARVLSQTGRWIALHGAAPVSDRSRRAAVIIEPARVARIAPLLVLDARRHRLDA